MSNRDQFLAYLRHYAAKHLDAITLHVQEHS